MSNEVTRAAAFFVRVCVEHGRLFPLRNILVVADGFDGADEETQFVEGVGEIVGRYRRGESFDDVPNALRDEFRRLG